MENDEVFAADANLEARSNVRARQDRSSPRGQDPVISKHRGSQISKHISYDETPLLSQDIDHVYGSSTEPSDDEDGRDPPTWSGERDFEGKAWWNKPSVSYNRVFLYEMY